MTHGAYSAKLIVSSHSCDSGQELLSMQHCQIRKEKEGRFRKYQMWLLEQVPKASEREFVTILFGSVTDLSFKITLN